MKTLWNDEDARKCEGDLALRVYSSRLLGREPDLVLHGGGNTSVKSEVRDIFGQSQEVLYVKGSGWDLATIEPEGFAPVKLGVLEDLAQLGSLTDTDMVRAQRAAMTDPGAPNPSVEAILHAIIPFKFVDHTHADAVVTITNSEGGEHRIRQIYGRRILIVPYVMPGFVLARRVFEMTRDFDWKSIEAMILLHHGVFTFADDARTSYERMIAIVSEAEQYLEKNGARGKARTADGKEDLLELARIRRTVSDVAGTAMIAKRDARPEAVGFANLPNVRAIASRGPLTPDHVLRTKRIPLIHDPNDHEEIGRYGKAYRQYFQQHDGGSRQMLDPAPRWAVWPEHGAISFGRTIHDADIVGDIIAHTMSAIEAGEALGGWKALPEKEIFAVEYWELEQAKLKKTARLPELTGKVAVVTGAASGIGRACVETLRTRGAAVVAADIDEGVSGVFDDRAIVPVVADLTNPEEVAKPVQAAIRSFGGLDMLVSNAGIFPPSETITGIDESRWRKSLETNLTSHRRLLQAAIPFLAAGIDPAIVIIASKNVVAPGRGAAAYSVAKAGLTQLARVAALELGSQGIRVNVIHPNNVFDTAMWTPEVLEQRAAHAGLTVDEYRANNVLRVEVTSRDVAELVCAMVGPAFAKTTGAQVPVDGGNDRVI